MNVTISSATDLIIPSETITQWQQDCHLISEVLNASAVIIATVNQSYIQVAIGSSAPDIYPQGLRITLADSYYETLLQSGSELEIKDATSYDKWIGSYDNSISMQYFYGFCLKLIDGSIYGIMAILSSSVLELSQLQIQIVRSLKEKIEYSLKWLFKQIELVDLSNQKQMAEEQLYNNSSFIAGLSHDIRTPMNSIVGFSDLLRLPQLNQNQKEKFVETILKNARSLLSIIDALVDFAKLDLGRLKASPSNIIVNKIIRDCVARCDEFRIKNSKDGIEIRFHPGNYDDSFSIESDSARLQQIINILLDNALSNTDEGYIDIGYSLQPDAHKSAPDLKVIRFFVKDTGTGISEELLPILFDRFALAEVKKKYKINGKGFNLPLAKQYANLLGGELTMQSAIGEGSVFYLTIPCKITQTEIKEEMNKKIGNVEIKDFDWSAKTILIAEDEESNCFFLSEALKQTGAQLLWAYNGKDAVEIVKSNSQIDLILMDIKMPKVDGAEAAKAIISYFKDTKRPIIIAHTAYTMAEDRQKCIEIGFDDFLPKPIKSKDLLRYLNKYLAMTNN